MKKQKLSDRALLNIQWIESMCCVPDGRLVGQKVKLSPAQREWMEMIYGSPTRTFILSIPRKNAKTTTSAFLMLLHLCGPEAVPNGNAYSAAQSREQAGILFGLASKIVRMSPELSEYVAIKESAKTMICAELGTVYKALSAEASTAFGLSTSIVFHDELGQVRGPRSELYEALETASGAQANPLTIVISTQAPSPNDLLSLLISDAQTKSDPRIKCVVYQVPEDADAFDPVEIAKAQPNWHLMNQSEVLKMASDAKRMPSREASFRNYICNQQVEVKSPWLSGEVWKGAQQDFDWRDLRGRRAVAGLDLSSTTDLTGMVFLVEPVEAGEPWKLVPFAWLPDVELQRKADNDRVPYLQWKAEGYLDTTPGRAISKRIILQKLSAMCDFFEIIAVGYDRWRMADLISMANDDGITLPDMKEVGQGYKDFSPAIEAFERMLLNGEIAHAGHKVLDWCMSNAVIEQDGAENRKLSKEKATGRIDLAVAAVMAAGLVNQNATEKSFWELD